MISEGQVRETRTLAIDNYNLKSQNATSSCNFFYIPNTSFNFT
jgi:hypothetical protein